MDARCRRAPSWRAGLVDVEVAEIETEQIYDSLEGWWEQIYEVSGPLAAVLDSLPNRPGNDP